MALGKLAPDLAKPDIQPVASHSIDAMCAYAAACASVDFCSFVGGNPSHSDPESFTNDNQSNLVPSILTHATSGGSNSSQRTSPPKPFSKKAFWPRISCLFLSSRTRSTSASRFRPRQVPAATLCPSLAKTLCICWRSPDRISTRRPPRTHRKLSAATSSSRRLYALQQAGSGS